MKFMRTDLDVADVPRFFSAWNERFRPEKRKHAAVGDWVKYILCVNPACRIEAFAEVAHFLSDVEYWMLLGFTLNETYVHGIYHDLFLAFLRSARPHREMFLYTKIVRDRHFAAPDSLRVFRGHAPWNAEGLYWTTDYAIARMHGQKVATYYPGFKGEVSEKTIEKRDFFFIGGVESKLVYVPGLGDIQEMAAKARNYIPYDCSQFQDDPRLDLKLQQWGQGE